MFLSLQRDTPNDGYVQYTKNYGIITNIDFILCNYEVNYIKQNIGAVQKN